MHISNSKELLSLLHMKKLFLDFYRFMLAARKIDLIEAEYIAKGEAFFHLSGAGHETIVTLFPLLAQLLFG